MKDDIKLLPCPFCGHTAMIDYTVEPHTHKIAKFMPDIDYYETFICCTHCSAGIAGKPEDSKEAAEKVAIKQWNTRYQPQQEEKEPQEKQEGRSCDNCLHDISTKQDKKCEIKQPQIRSLGYCSDWKPYPVESQEPELEKSCETCISAPRKNDQWCYECGNELYYNWQPKQPEPEQKEWEKKHLGTQPYANDLREDIKTVVEIVDNNAEGIQLALDKIKQLNTPLDIMSSEITDNYIRLNGMQSKIDKLENRIKELEE